MVSPRRVEEPHFPVLFRQEGSNSFCNLATLDHETRMVNSNSPKSLNETNLDLISTADHDQEDHYSMRNPSSSSSSPSSSASIFLGNLNLNRTPSRKTADEVWEEIVHRQEQHFNFNSIDPTKPLQHQITLGGATLEEFLAQASVLKTQQQPLMAVDSTAVMSHHQPDWLKFPMAAAALDRQMTTPLSMVDSNFQVPELGFESPDVGHSENRLSLTIPASMMPESSSNAQVSAERKRSVTDEMMEKSIERRQKRMIKNRESAARSRARKQAYTNQLEQEVFQLTKTNSWLKKQMEIERLLSSSCSSNLPRYQLRRTSSAPF